MTVLRQQISFMNSTIFRQYAARYKKELLEQVIPFWINHSIDSQYSGFLTCLEEEGKCYDTDKFIWLQARQVWLFSMIYNQIDTVPQWLDIAVSGAEFLIKKGRSQDQQSSWYFAVTREGQPLVQPYNIFSDCFAAMAFAELFKATKNEYYKEIALQTFKNILRRKDNPKGKWNKNAGGRKLQNFTLPMILCNLTVVMQDILGQKTNVKDMYRQLIQSIMTNFLKDNLLLENVGKNGQQVDCFEGRLINPGHSNQAVWFLLKLADQLNDDQLKKKLVDILIATTRFGEDNQYGGIFYFKDKKGYPPQQLEHDQKLWWVHIETLIAFLKAYQAVPERRKQCFQQFKKLQQYTWKHFRDTEKGGEWWGYLNRKGQILLRLKGGKWKGCFHVPRGLFQIYRTCEEIAKELQQEEAKP